MCGDSRKFAFSVFYASIRFGFDLRPSLSGVIHKSIQYFCGIFIEGLSELNEGKLYFLFVAHVFIYTNLFSNSRLADSVCYLT